MEENTPADDNAIEVHDDVVSEREGRAETCTTGPSIAEQLERLEAQIADFDASAATAPTRWRKKEILEKKEAFLLSQVGVARERAMDLRATNSLDILKLGISAVEEEYALLTTTAKKILYISWFKSFLLDRFLLAKANKSLDEELTVLQERLKAIAILHLELRLEVIRSHLADVEKRKQLPGNSNSIQMRALEAAPFVEKEATSPQSLLSAGEPEEGLDFSCCARCWTNPIWALSAALTSLFAWRDASPAAEDETPAVVEPPQCSAQRDEENHQNTSMYPDASTMSGLRRRRL